MPELDYALLGDYVRTDSTAVAHVIAAGIDTAYATSTPTGRNVGLLTRLLFNRGEAGRPHRVEVFFTDQDGTRLLEGRGIANPTEQPDLPPGWRSGYVLGLNLGLPLPDYGSYSLEIMVDDQEMKTIPFRVVPRQGSPDRPAGR